MRIRIFDTNKRVSLPHRVEVLNMAEELDRAGLPQLRAVESRGDIYPACTAKFGVSIPNPIERTIPDGVVQLECAPSHNHKVLTHKLIFKNLKNELVDLQIEKRRTEFSVRVSFASPVDLEVRAQKIRTRNEFQRNPKYVLEVKEMYGSQCQVCGIRLALPGGNFYAEAHHIRGLGEGGPDSVRNMLCVCANCHALLDLKALELDFGSLKALDAEHKLNSEFIKYHNARHRELWSN